LLDSLNLPQNQFFCATSTIASTPKIATPICEISSKLISTSITYLIVLIKENVTIRFMVKEIVLYSEIEVTALYLSVSSIMVSFVFVKVALA